MTLEPTIVTKLKKLAHKNHTSFKATVDEILRCGLAAKESNEHEPPFVVKPHSGGFKPGVDQAKLNQLVDQLEANDFVAEAARIP